MHPVLPRVLILSQQEYIPDLYTHFLNVGLEAHMYASQWFLTLFTAKFPLYMVFHIIDLLLCEVGGEPSQTGGPCLKIWREKSDFAQKLTIK